jgi:hypothetical protein
MDDLSMPRRGGWLGLAVAVLLAYASPLSAQVPTRIPSDPEAQIFNLIQRVTALEQKVAALSRNTPSNRAGTTPTRVTAPFEVVDASGRPIFQVVQFGPNLRMTTAGMVVTNEPTTGSAVLLAFNKRRQTAVALGAGPEGYGQLTLRDRRGHTRATLEGEGTLTISDQRGNGIFHVAEDVSEADAQVRIGKDDGDWIVDVGAGEGGVTLASSKEGGEVWIYDAKGTELAYLGDGLNIKDAAGKTFFSVAEDVSSDSAAVTIGKESEGYRMAITSGTTSAVIGASGNIAGFATYQGERAVGSLMLTEGSNSLELANDGGVNVVSLMVSEGGNGMLQLGNSSGHTVVDAGTTGEGVGLIRAYPVGSPGAGLVGMPGTFLIGRR